eukprot:CAMPEP_0174869614 /NCGR_PEP_ID=MMETSP1114-20130205/68170_1 /TAXON_ID=312471 /ORGANISM="Neobodo designis, Strain CCAP 1951/1" /LENGTH=117 /DNA_ID=CAMNT_0016104865 /DNA_START=63 /DNA_END=413 /DNA_ORIENTATION=+
MTLDGTTGQMKGRIAKFRAKGFHFVEAPHVGGPGGTRVTLWHGTSASAAAAIVAGGFKVSTGGNLGSGVYMSRDMRIVKQFAAYYALNSAIVCGDVDTGKVITMQGFDSSGSWRNGG